MTDEVLFECEGDCYLPTPLAGSPWHPALLHGGAPAALLAHCLEQSLSNVQLKPTRLTIDLMRPVPRSPLSVSLRTLRQGKRIELHEATLMAAGKVVALATGLFVLPQAITVPAYAPLQNSTLPVPESLPDTSFKDVLFAGALDLPPGLHTTVQLRAASPLCEQGQGKAWISLPATIVRGQDNSAFMLAALVADFSNGIGQLALGNNVGTINADLSLQLLRLPESNWIGLDARTLVQAEGIAMVQALMFDTKGLIGQVTQSAMPMGSSAGE